MVGLGTWGWVTEGVDFFDFFVVCKIIGRVGVGLHMGLIFFYFFLCKTSGRVGVGLHTGLIFGKLPFCSDKRQTGHEHARGHICI